jgi:hypothetical protein
MEPSVADKSFRSSFARFATSGVCTCGLWSLHVLPREAASVGSGKAMTSRQLVTRIPVRYRLYNATISSTFTTTC